MEDHSLYGYLRRQSTKELESLLAYYLQKANSTEYEYVVLEIRRVQEERFNSPGDGFVC